jgi:hypothetical protein
MPLNCPKFTQQYNSYYARYNACLDCGSQHGNECWFNFPTAQKLADILTLEERVAILEDRKESPEVNVVTISHQDYQQLQRLILSLQERIDSHIGLTIAKKKGYTHYE